MRTFVNRIEEGECDGSVAVPRREETMSPMSGQVWVSGNKDTTEEVSSQMKHGLGLHNLAKEVLMCDISRRR